MKRVLLLAVFAVAMLVSATSAWATTSYFNGFETDTNGWNALGGTIERVGSGTGGVTSATGNYHAQLHVESGCGTDCSGPFTRFGPPGSYESVFPAGGYLTQVDVYLDTAWATANPDRRFDWESAINDTAGEYLRGFDFNLGTEAGGFVGQTSTNATRSGANPYYPCPAPTAPPNACRPPFHITATGWYTFRTSFRDVSGELIVTFEVLDKLGNTIHTSQIDHGPMAGVGGHRAGWFANQEIPELAIDNSLLKSLVTQRGDKTKVRDEIAAAASTATDHDKPKLTDAAKKITESLANNFWVDDNHLNPVGGEKVFDKEKDAVARLRDLQNDSKTTISDAQLEDWIDRLVAIDRKLAQTALDDAAATGGNAKKLNEGAQEMSKGDADAANNKPNDAIDHYKRAWQKARDAVS